jgi:DNA-binding response OmpR family regulator
MQAEGTAGHPVARELSREERFAPDSAGAASEDVAQVVLFGEDEFELRMIERYLSHRGFSVTRTQSLTALAESADVIVTRLSATTGPALLHAARDQHPGLPFLGLTDDPETAMAAYRAGADIVAQLPIDLDLLCCKVAVLVARSRAGRPFDARRSRVGVAR